MILITTSHRPTRRMRTLCNDFHRVLPNTIRINRGKLNFEGIVEKALDAKADRMIIVERWKGGPGKIRLYTVSLEAGQFYPIIYLVSTKTQDDLGRRKTIRRDLAITIQQNAPEKIIRLAHALSQFLKIPLFKGAPEDPNLQASIHMSGLKRYEAKIAFTMPPIVEEIGPILIVKNLVWENFEEEN